MKKVLKIVAFASSVLSLNACGSGNGDREVSQVSGAKSKGEGHVNFNLGEYLEKYTENRLKTDPDWQVPKYIKASSAGIAVGKKNLFYVTNNVKVKSEPQAVYAQYSADAYAFKVQITQDHVIEAMAQARTDRPEAEFKFRIAGVIKQEGKIKAKKTLTLYRGNVGGEINYPLMAGFTLDLKGEVGGDINFDIGPKFDLKNKTAEVEIVPKLALVGNASAGASALIASAALKSAVVILKGSMPISGGFYMGENRVEPVLLMQPLELKTLSGSVDVEATLSLGNVLPGPARNIWKAVFGKGLTYEYNLFKWDGNSTYVTDGYLMTPQLDL